MDHENSDIAKRLDALEARNKRVDVDKRWETSLERKVLIAILTYLVLAAYMGRIGVYKPWENAVIPTAGFLLSTLTVQWAKQLWVNRRANSGSAR